MHFKDAYRAQFFLGQIEDELNNLAEFFSKAQIFSNPFKETISDFITQLCSELDQIILPTICFEIHQAKIQNILIGKSPKDRYRSFFEKNENFSKEALSIIRNYSFLFETLDDLIKSSFANLKECILRLLQDEEHLQTIFKLSKIKSISIVSNSDRHRNKQTLLIICENQVKLIYKPTDLLPDLLLEDFIRKLDLPDSFDLKCMRVIPKNEYGWIEYIEQLPCNTVSEVKDFYRRAGALLAISDSLNYTDGHSENLIANGSYPILLDGETLFQNYDIEVLKNKNILSTSLIQKSENQTHSLFSAFQAPAKEKIEILHTYAVNDHTDEIFTRYQGISCEKNKNCPFIPTGQSFTANEFTEDFVNGFEHTYRHISKNVSRILNNNSWWNKVANLKSRLVIRETSAYLYLIRQIQQPTNCKTKNDCENFIRKKIFDSPFLEYEIDDLLSLNIPYFYHFPGKRNLYNGKGEVYSDIFQQSAVDILKNQFLGRNEKKKEFDCAIILKHIKT